LRIFRRGLNEKNDLNNLIYAAATIMKQTLNEPSKEAKIEEMLSSEK